MPTSNPIEDVYSDLNYCRQEYDRCVPKLFTGDSKDFDAAMHSLGFMYFYAPEIIRMKLQGLFEFYPAILNKTVAKRQLELEICRIEDRNMGKTVWDEQDALRYIEIENKLENQ